ncbi:MAG: guanylate kinase [Spirochaetes bacterium]|nr:guanylate kinase [Spirochaetota bacterium]
MNDKGRLIIVTGPSGVGKTTLLKRLLEEYKDKICFSVSHTSRKARSNELNGIDYIFDTEEEFKNRIKSNEFLEYAVVHGNYYGTSKHQVQKVLDSGMDCLLDIDVQGGTYLMMNNIKGIYIFIAPPSIDILRERLLKRSTDPVDVIEKRVKNAEKELQFKDKYQYIIINDKLKKAYNELKNIIFD